MITDSGRGRVYGGGASATSEHAKGIERSITGTISQHYHKSVWANCERELLLGILLNLNLFASQNSKKGKR